MIVLATSSMIHSFHHQKKRLKKRKEMPAFFNVVSMPGTMHLGRHMAWGAENVAHHSVRKGCEQTDFRWMCHGWYIYNMERSLKILVTYFLFFFSLLLSARSHSRHIIVSFLFLRPPFLPSFFSFLPHPCSARLSWPSTASTVAKPAGLTFVVVVVPRTAAEVTLPLPPTYVIRYL